MDPKELNTEEFLQKVAEQVTGGLTGEIEKAVALAMEEKVKNLGLDKTDRKFGVFPTEGLDEKTLGEMTKEQRVKRFLKAVVMKDWVSAQAVIKADPDAKTKGMSEGTDTAGGYLVPSEFRAEIMRVANDYGLARRIARKIPMNRDSLSLPVITNGVSVSWPGEGNAGTSSKPTFGLANLVAKTMVGLTPITNELLDDSAVDVLDTLVELFAEAIAGEEDNQAFNGTGLPFTGILNASGVTTVTMSSGNETFAELSSDDFVDLIANLNSTVRTGARFIMHDTVFAYVQKLKDDEGRPLYQMPTQAAPGNIFGYPVETSTKMPSSTAVSTPFIILGNLSRYLLLGDRQEMRMAVSDQATVTDTDGSTALNLFEQNMSAVRLTERIAINVPLSAAFAILKTAAS